jgi:glycosyltransferase involved in cell wall biosynthesis
LKKLSILIPCYNEEQYVWRVLQRVLDVPLCYDIEKEIIIINDGSTDQTQKEIYSFEKTITELINIYKRANAKNDLKYEK